MLRKTIFCLSALALAAASAPANAVSDGAAGSAPMPSASMPTIDPAVRYREGVAALDAKKYKEAQRAFRDVLSASGKDANANYMMGLALAGDSKIKDSRSYFERAVKANADFATARGWLGYAQVKTGQTEKAAEQKTALVALKAKCAGACKDAADIDVAIKQIDDAIANPAAAIDPVLPKLAAAEGDAAYLAAFGLINQGRYADALPALREAGMVFGPHPDVLTYTGFANRKLGNYEIALGYYAAALKLQPNHRGANEYLGEYYVEVGDMARAKRQLAKLETICKFGCEEAYELRRWIDGKQT